MDKKVSVRSIVLLVGAYITCQLIADIGATRFVQIAGLSLSAGTFVFALTFTLRDMIHKRLGREWATAAISAAALFNVFLAGYLWLISLFPAPGWYQLSEGWNAIFSLVPAITIGSILAEFISEHVDTAIYHFWSTSNSFKRWPQWTRVLASNVVSIPVDSAVFCSLAFSIVPWMLGSAGGMTLGNALLYAAGGQVIFKVLITLVSLPMIYLTKERA